MLRVLVQCSPQGELEQTDMLLERERRILHEVRWLHVGVMGLLDGCECGEDCECDGRSWVCLRVFWGGGRKTV